MSLAYVYVALCVASIAIGQLLFKYVATKSAGVPLTQAAGHPDVLAAFLLGVLIYAASTILWVMALRDLALSRAYVFVALAFLLVPLGARLAFGEELTPTYFIGAALIVVGVVVSVS